MNLQNHVPIIQGAAAQLHANGIAVAAIHRSDSINLSQVPDGMRCLGRLSEELETMFRKIMFALLALATIGAAAVPSTAQARGGWGGGRGGWGGGRGWGGRGFGWGAVGVGVGLGLAAGYPYYGGGYYGYGPGPYGCWRTVRVGTPYGW